MFVLLFYQRYGQEMGGGMLSRQRGDLSTDAVKMSLATRYVCGFLACSNNTTGLGLLLLETTALTQSSQN